MSEKEPSRLRATVDGKFLRLGEEKFYVKGLTYGPFAPNVEGEPFAHRDQTKRDFAQILELGVNTLRVYHVPPLWFMDLALAHQLKLIVDVPWLKEICFLDSPFSREAARTAVRQAALMCRGHPAVLALSLTNEIPPDVVRWSGALAVADFLDELAGLVKSIDPECLCTFGNFPPTEYLRPRDMDFVCFNVYLHQSRTLENYLARLQNLSETKPLLLGEFGIDSLGEGEIAQSRILRAQIEVAFRGGVAGMVVYSYTDDWHKDGQPVSGWRFGLTDRQRKPKPAFFSVQEAFRIAPQFPLRRYPYISVVVACYNAARTLRTCLDSLARLRYPQFEVMVVDDGSTDATHQIASGFPFRIVRHEINLGLSVARNSGIAAARGEIVAFTDADCRVDEDWLYYLAATLLEDDLAAAGGPNLLPPDDSWIAAAVMVSPGGPAHVMLTDRLAEHIPGCNMAFYKWALEEIGGFDPIFHKAGDDVDVCWRIQQAGYRIGFSPAAFVWHYRRSTIRDYLKQQHGYGEAEALLVHRHPENFSFLGGGIWHGRIYSQAKLGLLLSPPRIYHGVFARGLFQTLYTAQPELATMLFTSLEYQVLIALPLVILAVPFPFLAAPALTSLLIPWAVCIAAALQAELPRKKKRFWSRFLIALLYYLQPLVRGWARYQGHLGLGRKGIADLEHLPESLQRQSVPISREVHYWASGGVTREQWLASLLGRLEQEGWQHKTDTGWNDYDIEITGSRWSRLQLTTVAEAYPGGKRLLRCRMRSAWTFLARVTFFSTMGLELLLIGLWHRNSYAEWLILLSLPLIAFWLRHENRKLKQVIILLLDQMADKLGLVKVPVKKK